MMLRVGTGAYVEAPTEFVADGSQSVFLAGGITDCPDWQTDAATYLADTGVTVLNPRRADFPISDPTAAPAQIAWEFRHLRRADVVLFWFSGGPSPQPIVLYELGAHANNPEKPIVVGCDPGYIRRQDVVEQLSHVRPGLPIHDSLAATCAAVLVALAKPAA